MLIIYFSKGGGMDLSTDETLYTNYKKNVNCFCGERARFNKQVA